MKNKSRSVRVQSDEISVSRQGLVLRRRKILLFATIILVGVVASIVWMTTQKQADVNAAQPTIVSALPASGPTAGSTSVAITGTDFLPAVGDITSIDAGYDMSCGIYQGNIYCWGKNENGQLGNGTTNDSVRPVRVHNSSDGTGSAMPPGAVKSLSVGRGFACAIASNDMAYCWGLNANSQFGNGGTTSSSVPVKVPTKTENASSAILAGATFKSIAAGTFGGCAIANDNRAYCWGANFYGQTGDGTSTNRTFPVKVLTKTENASSAIPAGATFLSVSVGGYTTCAIASNDMAYCWGRNQNGQVGAGTAMNENANPFPLKVVTKTENATSAIPAGATFKFVETARGGSFSCAIASDDLSYCWGFNDNGQLGSNTVTNSSFPVKVLTQSDAGGATSAIPAGVTAKALTVGAAGGQACMIGSDNLAYCWGFNVQGALGNNSTTQNLVPVKVLTQSDPGGSSSAIPAGETFLQIRGGTQHTCALGSSGTMYCWGANGSGQVGNSKTTDSLVVAPVYWQWPTIDNLPCESFQIVSATLINCVTTAHIPGKVDVSVVAIPYNITLNLPLAYEYTDPMTVTAVSPTRSTIAGGVPVTITGTNFAPRIADMDQIAAGPYHTCGVYQGKAYCWGSNSAGQLGNSSIAVGATTNVPVPVATNVMTGSVTSIVAGYSSTCALSAGKVYCWGNNTFGQVGDNTGGPASVNRTTPVAVSITNMPGTVTKISGGSQTYCAMSGTRPYCWGHNSFGEVGTGSATAATTGILLPTAVTTAVLAGTVTDIASGWRHTCAIVSGLVRCWGENLQSELGNNSLVNSLTSVPVPSTVMPAGVTAIYGQWLTTCGVSGGKAYCWGRNDFGQFGNGTTRVINTAAPVTVVDPTNIMPGPITSMAVGYASVCAISNNRAYCWGKNTNGELGIGTTTDSTTPKMFGDPLQSFASTTVIATSGYITTPGNVPNEHTCAITNAGKAYCTGSNEYGELGNNALANSSVPVPVYGGVPTVKFDTSDCTNVVLVSATQITCTNPAHAVAVVDVSVDDGNGRLATLPQSFTYYDIPSAPLNPAAAPASATSVYVSWSAPATDNNAVITDYVIQYSDNGGGTWTTFNDGVSTNLFATVTGLSANTTYTFRIAAVNEAGQGPYSATVSSQTTFITLGSGPNVDIHVTPSSSERTSSNSDTVTVSTNSTTGYNLTVENTTTNRNLVRALGGTIAPSGGSLATPVVLATNTWGYRVDGTGGFGSGPTTAELNVATSGFTWAGVPALGSADTIRNESLPATSQQTRVWYSMSADMTKAAGQYTTTVVYTAVANP